MIKKIGLIIGVSAAYFLQAQDISTLRNTVDVYSNTSLEGSAKYQGMAGSMGALGGDFSTLNTNPAGIGVSITNDFSGTLGIYSNKNETSYSGKQRNYKINKTDLGSVGGVAVLKNIDNSRWKFLNIGVNYTTRSVEDYSQSPGDTSIGFDIKDGDGNLVDQLSFAGHAYNRYGHQSKMSIGVGTNYDNKIYLGLGLNFLGAAIDQYDSAAFASSKFGSTDVYNKQYTPFSESSNGFSASVGIIGKVNQNLRLGAAIETPTWWNISRVFNYYEDPVYGDGSATEDRKLSTPLKTTLSAAFVANKNFSLNVDYSLGLTKPKYKVYGAAEKELNNFFDEQYKNLSEIKVGAEYRLAGFRLRGGYGYASSPFANMTLNSYTNGTPSNQSYTNLIAGKTNTIAAGLGYDFRSFYVDAAFQNITSDYNSPFLQGSSSFNSGYFSNNYIVNSDAYAVAKVKNVKNNFFITLGWRF